MGTKVATARTIVCLLMRCFGCYGRARHGAISIRHLDTGTVCSNALIGGPARVFGIVFSRPWQPIQISSRSCSMPPSSGHTSIRPAQKGDSKSGDRALARRLEYQDPHCRRCAWSSDADDPHRRPSTRGHSGLSLPENRRRLAIATTSGSRRAACSRGHLSSRPTKAPSETASEQEPTIRIEDSAMRSCACPTCTLNCPRQVFHLSLARGGMGVRHRRGVSFPTRAKQCR